MRVLRWQLPAYSPLRAGAVWRSLLRQAGREPDARSRLRRNLLQDYGAEAAVLCGSGTQALQLACHMAYQLLGGAVIAAVPAFTCFGVATAVVGADAQVALYDVDPATLAPDFDSLLRALRGGARLVIVSPLFGIPIDWKALETCTTPYGAVVVEDAAQGHGAAWDGRPVGGLGTLSVLSFARGKGWSGGCGGALLLRGAAARAAGPSIEPRGGSVGAELRVLFSLLAHRVLGRPTLYRIPVSMPWLGLGETRYEDPETPKPISHTAAVVLACSHEAARCEAAARRTNAAFLLQRIPFGRQVRRVEGPRNVQPGFLRLPLRLAHGFRGFPAPQRAIQLGVAPTYPHPLHMLKEVYARLVNRGDQWPGASELARELVTLPTHSLVTSAEREELVGLMARYGC